MKKCCNIYSMRKLIKGILSCFGLDGRVWNFMLKMSHLKHYMGMGFPAGHFYSPIPSLDDVKARRERIFSSANSSIERVNLNKDAQLMLLKEFEIYWEPKLFQESKTEGCRFFINNPSFSYGDAAILYAFLRHFKPKKVIEIGCGYSSAVMLDTNEKYLDRSIDYTFIEPYPEVLYSVLHESDFNNIEIINKKVQEVDINVFTELCAGDLLFIDSSHVSKIDSDVNFLFFEVLPKLSAGVYIHFHDIFYNFEYPEEWVNKGLAWNESYLLRAFLLYNDSFDIILFNNYIGRHFSGAITHDLPEYNSGGSIYLKKKVNN